MKDNQQDITPISIQMKFADVRLPEAKKATGKYPFMRFGDGGENDFPDKLLYLINKSAKHGALIQGKAQYIQGNGIQTDNEAAKQWAKKVNRFNESLQDIANKFILDCESFGGFYVEEVWDKMGNLAEIYHHEFNTVRISEDGQTFYVKKDWKDSKEIPLEIPITKTDRNTGRTMQMFKEYRSGNFIYPLPGYIGILNYVETDVEISKFHLSAIKNGLFPSWAVIFNNGNPPDETKKEVENAIRRKFSGSENAGTFWLIYNDDPAKAPIFQDLSNTNLDKHFDLVAKRVQEEIFIGHGITNPMLFGVKTEGQLGGATELRNSYEVFQNTYVNKKQIQAEGYINSLARLAGIENPGFKIIPSEPIGIQFSESIIKEIAPKSWILERLGIDVSKYPDANIVLPASGQTSVQATDVNDNLKNITGKQWIQINRIIREYGKGKTTLQQAKVFLQGGFGLSEDDINTLLGIEPLGENETAEMFASFGESKHDYHVLFSDEADFSIELNFAANNQTQADILDLIKKDKRITNETISEVLKLPLITVAANVASLENQGLIEVGVVKVGTDTIPERKVTEPLKKAIGNQQPETKEILIRYSYEVRPGAGAEIIPTTRPFCKKLIELDKFYSRADIESISERVGYSVWDRRGGWWGNSPVCRHYWKVNLLKRKKQ